MNDFNDNVSDDDAPPPDDQESPDETLPSGCAVNIRGWENDDEAEAREFGLGVFSSPASAKALVIKVIVTAKIRVEAIFSFDGNVILSKLAQ